MGRWERKTSRMGEKKVMDLLHSEILSLLSFQSLPRVYGVLEFCIHSQSCCYIT